jgi:ribosomal protein L18E
MKISMCKLLFLALFFFLNSLQARDVVDDTGICKLNWTKGYILCEGESAEDQGSFAAKLSAKIIARRNMLEVIKGVRIDSVVTVKDGMLSSDIINSSVSGVIRGSQVISNVYNRETKSAVAVVKLVMGKDLLSALKSDSKQVTWNEKVEEFWNNFSLIATANASTYSIQDKKTLEKLRQDLKKHGNKESSEYITSILEDISKNIYSGIIIDVSRISKFEKTLIVSLVDEEGNEIYPGDFLSDDILFQKTTSVGFIYGFEDARNDVRVFNKPLEMKAKNIFANRHSSIVLTKEQIETIKALPSEVLSNAKIILVLGD